MNIAAKAIKGSFFNIGASIFTLSIGFLRSLILARLLLPEHYGVVTLALFFVHMVGYLRNFGFDRALVHRRDTDEKVVSTHFFLQSGSALLFFSIAILLSPLLKRWYPANPALSSVFIVLASLYILRALGRTPRVLLEKELEFKSIAIIDVVKSVVKTIIPVTMAWLGFGLWSLVAEEGCEILISTLGVWMITPWRPTLIFDARLAHWYLHFGSLLLIAALLSFLLMQFDDFWVGSVLGNTALGFYSLAYAFAGYPKRAIAAPLLQVFFPTFAKVQRDRLQLSKAFYRLCSFLVRLGFLVSIAFVSVAPEFVRLFIGSKWLPMVTSFRLLVVYAMLLPLFEAASNLLTAVGEPKKVLSVRVEQFLVFLPAVIFFTRWWGINGTAVAADLMMLVGMVLIMRHVRLHVDLSLSKMFAPPSIALGAAIPLLLLTGQALSTRSDGFALVVKGCSVLALYSLLLLVLERQDYLRGFREIYELVRTGEW